MLFPCTRTYCKWAASTLLPVSHGSKRICEFSFHLPLSERSRTLESSHPNCLIATLFESS